MARRNTAAATTHEISTGLRASREERQSAGVRGRLEGLSPMGALLVRVASRVMAAEIAISCSDAELLGAIRDRREVLITYIDDDPLQPVVVGLLRRSLSAGTTATPQACSRERLIELDAGQTIVLRAGAASIELHADGRIELRGVEITSIAEGTNRVIGARVAVN